MAIYTHKEGYKEVHFNDYCEKCKHALVNVMNEPCNECLDNPVNLYTHKPVNFEEKEG